MPPRRSRPPAGLQALGQEEQAQLQGHWVATGLGVAEVVGSQVFYPRLQQEFQLYQTKDGLLALGEYRARLHPSCLEWEIPSKGDAISWVKLALGVESGPDGAAPVIDIAEDPSSPLWPIGSPARHLFRAVGQEPAVSDLDEA
ncbi:unnamed protein product [Effrenium voratum]|nr:unnamed protein product [Effrenium voratum]